MQSGAARDKKETYMALLDPTDHTRMSYRSGEHQPTTKPRLCLMAGFLFLIAIALAFHFAFTALT